MTKTFNEKVYQNTKINAKRHITDNNKWEDGSTALERSATHVTEGFKPGKPSKTSPHYRLCDGGWVLKTSSIYQKMYLIMTFL